MKIIPKPQAEAAARTERRQVLMCLLILAGAYELFERFGQPLWSTRWHLYLFVEGLTHLVLAGSVLALFRPIDRSFWFWVPLTLVPDLDHLLWAQYRNFFHTPIFILSPLLFRPLIGRGAANLSVLFGVHWIFDTRSQMAWWKTESVWLLPPIGVPMLPPWAPLAGLLALCLLILALQKHAWPLRTYAPRFGQVAAGAGLAIIAFGHGQALPAGGGGGDAKVRLHFPAGVVVRTDETTSVVAKVENDGMDPGVARLSVRSAPRGWHIQVPDGPVALAPGSETEVRLSIFVKGGPPTFTETSAIHEVVLEITDSADGTPYTATLTAMLKPSARDLSIYFGLPFLLGGFCCALGSSAVRRGGGVRGQGNFGSWMAFAGGILAIVCGTSAAGLLLLA